MITAKVKKQFFDRQAVIDAVGRAQARLFARAGAFVRTAARTSMRRRKAPAPPGKPPSVHSKDSFATLRNILFAWDPRSESLVVGPVTLNQSSFRGSTVVKGAVPAIQEFGGVIGEHQWQRRDGTWQRTDLRSRRFAGGRPQRIRRAIVRPHPFMFPAMQKEMPKFPTLWKNAVIRGAA